MPLKRFVDLLRVKKFLVLDVLAVLVYLSINIVMLLHHEPWSDEAQPWLVARDTGFGYFWKYLISNYDSHAALWYVILFPFAKTGFPYITQFIIHLIFAVMAAVVFIWKAPFHRLIRYLWVFSYLMVFEYAIVARMYAVPIFLLFLIASVYPKRFQHPAGYAALIFLLFNASHLCFGLSLGLTAAFILEAFGKERRAHFPRMAVAVMGLGGLLVLLQAGILPEDHCCRGGYLTYLRLYPRAMERFAKGFIPFWNDVSYYTASILSLSILGLALLALYKKPIPFMIFILGYLELFFIFIFVHIGDVRHHGFFVIDLLFVFWISKHYPEEDRYVPHLGKWLGRLNIRDPLNKALWILSVCLILNVRTAWIAQFSEYHFQFSGAKEMARRINEIFDAQDLDAAGYQIVAKPHERTVALLPYMPGRKFWYAYLNDFATYYSCKRYPVKPEDITVEEVIRRANAYFGSLERVFLLVNQPLEFDRKDGYWFRLLTSVEKNIWGTGRESFYLYKPLPLEFYEEEFRRSEKRRPASR